MPDFSQLLGKTAGQAKRPEPLPIGDYPGVVSRYELGDNNRNKTPYLRLFVTLTGWPSNFTQSDIKPDIDLSKRQMRRDIFTTPDSLWRLDQFIESCGIEPNGRSYEQVLPELVGQPVIAAVNTYTSTSGDTGNQIDTVVGVNGK